MTALRLLKLRKKLRKSLRLRKKKTSLVRFNFKVSTYLRKRYLRRFELDPYGGGAPVDSKLFVAKELIITILKNQLLKRNLAVGFGESQTHAGFYTRISGFHKKISLINSNMLVYQLRKYFKFILLGLLKNYRFCFVGFELDEEFDRQSQKAFFFDYHVILGLWLAGTVSNYKKLSRQKVRYAKKFLPRIPQVVVTLGGMQANKVYDITKETYKAGLPIINFLDSNTDLIPFTWVIPINTKHETGVNYYFFLLTVLIRRSVIIKKLHFLKKKKKNVFTKKKKNS
jgi:ribosomal protein S2